MTLYQLLQEWHVLVASDSVPQRFERHVDNLAAAVSVHVGITGNPARQSGVFMRFGSALGRCNEYAISRDPALLGHS